jgi:hypothetical protein
MVSARVVEDESGLTLMAVGGCRVVVGERESGGTRVGTCRVVESSSEFLFVESTNAVT